MNGDDQDKTAASRQARKESDEERQETRGEQGTSSGDPHDDTDPQSG
ncbi:hypothetical protein [Amycolatopsis orientalis]|nr:hypothetical protein [Amycolatopsis orientalis]